MENENNTQQFPVVNSEIFNSPKISPKKKGSISPVLLIIPIITIILVSMVVFILVTKNKQIVTKQNNISNQTEINNNQQSSSTIGKGMYGWNYYKDKNTGISFSYPNDWILHVDHNKFDITKNNYHIKIGIGIGDSPINTIAAKQENIQLFNRTLSKVYSNSQNNACTTFSGNTPSVKPISAACINTFDTIFLTNTNCFTGPICSGGTWPIPFEWIFTPKPPLTIGIYIAFISPSLISFPDSTSNQYIVIFNKFISTIDIPSSISSSIL